jgi:hypothetical protein
LDALTLAALVLIVVVLYNPTMLLRDALAALNNRLRPLAILLKRSLQLLRRALPRDVAPRLGDPTEPKIDFTTKVVALTLAVLVAAWLVAFAVLLVMFGEGQH